MNLMADSTRVSRSRYDVIGSPIDHLSWEQALWRLQTWAAESQSRYVCICNVHSVVTARLDDGFSRIITNADMATADGAPLAWLMRRKYGLMQDRINGPDLMWQYFLRAADRGESVYLYGGMQATVERLRQRLERELPKLRIAGVCSPPFRAMTAAEDDEIVRAINNSGAGTVWVSLGCPKQEQWMASHRGRINAPMIGVGAAFDYHAGTVRRAPQWMQRHGLEWLYRLASEPRRLWRRYLKTNSLFIYYALKQFAGFEHP